MAKTTGQPGDDVSTAPESGTERDDTTGAADPRRGAPDATDTSAPTAPDDPSRAPEER